LGGIAPKSKDSQFIRHYQLKPGSGAAAAHCSWFLRLFSSSRAGDIGVFLDGAEA
jgi:hypothetical protein